MTKTYIVICAMVAAAGCGGSDAAPAPDEMMALMKAVTTSQDGHSTAGAAGIGATKLTGLGIAGTGAAGAPSDEPMKVDPGAAGAGEQTGSAGKEGAAGAGAAGTGAAGGAAGQGEAGSAGSTGAAGMGAAGAAGSTGSAGSGSTEIDCPLGAGDADNNGYPDACEQLLGTAKLTAALPSMRVQLDQLPYTSELAGVVVVSPANQIGVSCSGGIGTGLRFAQSTTSVSRIVDAHANTPASALTQCLEQNFVGVGIAASVETRSVASANQSLSNGIGTKDHHILYYQLTVLSLQMNALGGSTTMVDDYRVQIDAYGY